MSDRHSLKISMMKVGANELGRNTFRRSGPRFSWLELLANARRGLRQFTVKDTVLECVSVPEVPVIVSV